MCSRPPTEEEKKLQRDVLAKYNKEDLVDLLMLSQVDIWNIHPPTEKQNIFLKDIQRDFLKSFSKGQMLTDTQVEELIKMLQTTRGLAFSNNPVCDMNMYVSEAEYNAICNQLCGSYRCYSAPALLRRVKSACDDALSAALTVTTGKQNFKEAVMKKMVFEKLYHDRKDKELGKRTARVQIAEIRDRERRGLWEIKQQIKSLKDGRAFTPTSLYCPTTSPFLSQFQQPFGQSSALSTIGCGVGTGMGLLHLLQSPLLPTILSQIYSCGITPFPFMCGIQAQVAWLQEIFKLLGACPFEHPQFPYGVGIMAQLAWLNEQCKVFGPHFPLLILAKVKSIFTGMPFVQNQLQTGTPQYQICPITGQVIPVVKQICPVTGTVKQICPITGSVLNVTPSSTLGSMMGTQYPHTFGQGIHPMRDSFRQNYPELLHDVYADDYLDETEWDDNEDLFQHSCEDYENEGFMVPDITRFVGSKKDMKEQEMKMGQKKFISSSSKKEALK
jgi:hypothetical protein